MAVEERDPVSGHETTGHEWNGIKELDTPVPRGVLIFLIVTHVWAMVWWFLDADLAAGNDLHQGLARTPTSARPSRRSSSQAKPRGRRG